MHCFLKAEKSAQYEIIFQDQTKVILYNILNFVFYKKITYHYTPKSTQNRSRT